MESYEGVHVKTGSPFVRPVLCSPVRSVSVRDCVSPILQRDPPHRFYSSRISQFTFWALRLKSHGMTQSLTLAPCTHRTQTQPSPSEQGVDVWVRWSSDQWCFPVASVTSARFSGLIPTPLGSSRIESAVDHVHEWKISYLRHCLRPSVFTVSRCLRVSVTCRWFAQQLVTARGRRSRL